MLAEERREYSHRIFRERLWLAILRETDGDAWLVAQARRNFYLEVGPILAWGYGTRPYKDPT